MKRCFLKSEAEGRRSRLFSCVLFILIVLQGLSSIAVGSESADFTDSIENGCAHARALRSAYTAGLFPSFRNFLEEPTDTDVLHYDLQIEAIPSTQQLIGSCTITAKSLVDGLSEFHFRLDTTFTITALRLDGRPISYTRETAPSVRANFDQAYSRGETFQLTIEYNGVPAGGGFGSIEFGTHGGAPYVFTLSEPWFAYTWWPAKDENWDKTTLDISVIVPDSMVVAANGTLQSVEDLPGNRKRYHWATNYPITPYLVSFGATNYNTWTQTFNYNGGSMPVQFFIYPEYDTPANRTAWERCITMLDVFSQLYGLYPFIAEKYGIYQFAFGGGMEHQTITGQGGFGESLTAHELAHQWWGDMITCETWHDIWLNEGFATYSEATWLEHKPGSPGLPALKAAMQARRPSSVNGSVYCYDISSVSRIFSYNFTYLKAGWVLHQLRHVVGDAVFWNLLHEYRQQYEYQTATTDDFIAVAEAVAGRDLNWFFDKWVYGIGAPAYQWGWQNTTVNSKSYLLLSVRQTQSSSYGVFTMPIDIRPTVNGQKQNKTIWNDALVENYVIPLSNPATAVTFDEDGWILTTGVSQVTYVPGPPKIVETNPAPGALQRNQTSQVQVVFHTGVNTGTNDYTLTGQRTGAHSFSFSYEGANNSAVLTFAQPLPIDTYTLTVRDSVRASNSGQALDGEVSDPANPASLPSGDGQPGGQAVIRFRILLAGDVNLDDRVNDLDVAAVLSTFGWSGPDLPADLNRDGVVNQTDLGMVLLTFGQGN